MIINDLQNIVSRNRDKNPLFIRNLQKERLQFYVFDFVNKSPWSNVLILKGGTALRVCFDLPRLSEDIDFDFVNLDFKTQVFASAMQSYFARVWQFRNLETKISNSQRTLYLKFPEKLFLRLDFTPCPAKTYQAEISIKNVSHFSFFVKRYSLPDLFAGKICAILKRETMEGKIKNERYKGRDYFDLIWFLEHKTKPNWVFVEEATGFSQKQTLQKLKEKVERVKPSFIESDLRPFFETASFVTQFAKNFQQLFKQYCLLLK